MIEGGIRIVVLACDRKTVRLGIEAPPSVTILSGEIVVAISEENQRAAATSDASGWLSALPAPAEEPTPDSDD